MTEDLTEYTHPDELVAFAKGYLRIEGSFKDMSDNNIAKIMRSIGSQAPDTVWIEGKPVMGRIGLGVMLSLSLYVFPEFYVEHELWQRN